MKTKIGLLLLLCCGLLLQCGCSGKEPVDASKLKEVYFLNKAKTCVEMHEYEIQSTDINEQLKEMVTLLGTVPDKLEYEAPLNMGFKLNSYRMDGEKLYLDVDEAYREMPATTEILVRAALVRSFSQIKGVKYVTIKVDGGQLHDSLGNAVGLMSADQFIDNAGTEINSYEKVRLKLYFANQDGTGLIATNRTMAYNTNISMEKLILEQLISGPGADVATVAYPTINPNTKVVSVSVKDGICYVNLDEGFLNQIYNVSNDVAIYAIVNSLTELTNVNNVQITVNGETDVKYMETVSLTDMFQRNLDLVIPVK